MVQINELRDCCFEMTTEAPLAMPSSLPDPRLVSLELFVSRLRRELFQPLGSSKRSVRR